MAKSLRIFCLIVSVEEREVLIQRFGSVKSVEIIFRDHKGIEFMQRKGLHRGGRGREFGERPR